MDGLESVNSLLKVRNAFLCKVLQMAIISQSMIYAASSMISMTKLLLSQLERTYWFSSALIENVLMINGIVLLILWGLSQQIKFITQTIHSLMSNFSITIRQKIQWFKFLTVQLTVSVSLEYSHQVNITQQKCKRNTFTEAVILEMQEVSEFLLGFQSSCIQKTTSKVILSY